MQYNFPIMFKKYIEASIIRTSYFWHKIILYHVSRNIYVCNYYYIQKLLYCTVQTFHLLHILEDYELLRQCDIFWFSFYSYELSRECLLSMCDVKLFLTFDSLGLVLLWQLFYLCCSSIVINTVIVTAETFEP